MSTSNLLSENVDTFVVEWREAAEQSVEHTAHGPHIYTLAIPFVLDDLRGGVTYSTAWSHGLLVPNDLAEPEVGDLHPPDSPATDAREEVALVLLILIELLRRGYLGWDDWYTLEKEVLGFDIPVYNTACFMEVSNSLRDLDNDMPCEVFAEVRKLHDLVEQFASFHDCRNDPTLSA